MKDTLINSSDGFSGSQLEALSGWDIVRSGQANAHVDEQPKLVDLTVSALRIFHGVFGDQDFQRIRNQSGLSSGERLADWAILAEYHLKRTTERGESSTTGGFSKLGRARTAHA